jgi:hypothetical protein
VAELAPSARVPSAAVLTRTLACVFRSRRTRR